MADDLFKEIDDEARAERVRALGRRFGASAACLLLAVAIGVGIWQLSDYRNRLHAASASERYFAATKLADSSRTAGGSLDPQLAAKAIAGFAAASEAAPLGIATLARLRIAQLDWDSDHHSDALEMWDRVSSDDAVDQTLRGLAALLWVQHQIDTGDPAILKSRLGALSEHGGSWRPMAQELDALIDLRLGHFSEAKRKLAVLDENPQAPEGVRSRAAGLNDTITMTKTGL